MQKQQWQMAIGAMVLTWLSAGNAWAQQAQDVSISGNTWIAYAIIGALILGIVVFVLASVGIAKRDRADNDAPLFGPEE
jgi:hypothetical protein